jgi:hypothetical protein
MAVIEKPSRVFLWWTTCTVPCTHQQAPVNLPGYEATRAVLVVTVVFVGNDT